MKEVTVSELKKMMDDKADFQLLDIREVHEYEEANLGGELIPMGEVVDNIDKISKVKPVVIHCRSGARSTAIVNLLEIQFGFNNVYNLKGGIIAWKNEINPALGN